MDTFTITAYDKVKDTVTFNVTVDGQKFTGLKLQGIPKDSVSNVKAFFRSHADAYIAGKAQEAAAQADIANEVKALLNTPTEL
jgi:hypothetical protein